MVRFKIALFIVLTIALTSAANAKRAALVIGNSAYVHAGTLANPEERCNRYCGSLDEGRV